MLVSRFITRPINRYFERARRFHSPTINPKTFITVLRKGGNFSRRYYVTSEKPLMFFCSAWTASDISRINMPTSVITVSGVNYLPASKWGENVECSFVERLTKATENESGRWLTIGHGVSNDSLQPTFGLCWQVKNETKQIRKSTQYWLIRSLSCTLKPSAVKLVLSILITKANEIHSFLYLFDKVLYIFRIGLLSIIRSISTLYKRNRYLLC